MIRTNNSNSVVFFNTTDENATKENSIPLKKQASNITGSQPLALRNITNQTQLKTQIIPLKKQASNDAISQPLAHRSITNQTQSKTQVSNGVFSQPLALCNTSNQNPVQLQQEDSIEMQVEDSTFRSTTIQNSAQSQQEDSIEMQVEDNAEPQSRTFRSTTIQKSAESNAVPFEKETRTISKPGTTPSVTVTNNNRELDPDISKIKAEFRILLYFINAIIETVHNILLHRAKTVLQGTCAPKGCQAAHPSLAPNTRDRLTTDVIERVVEAGVTPTKTEPFLRQRIGLTTPDKLILDAKHTDVSFVFHFITKRLPKDGIHSILAGTQYNLNSNATFENPDESNQYDSRLEKTIASTLKELQELRLSGEDTPEESIEKLVTWLMDYYDKSIENIQKQIELLEQTSASLDKMHTFEQKHLKSTELPQEEFAAYLEEVGSFLESHAALMEKKVGCPTCRDLKHIRNDFSILKKLHTADDAADYFLNNRRHFTKQELFSAEKHLEKFNLYLLEAQSQQAAVDVFTEACTIQGMRTSIFGVYEDGIRRAPSDEELKAQVYAISAPIKIEKNKVAKKMKFDEADLEQVQSASKKKKTTHNNSQDQL